MAVLPTLIVVSGPWLDAPGHEAAHNAFRPPGVGLPSLEVDTTNGYRPSFGQIMAFIGEEDQGSRTYP